MAIPIALWAYMDMPIKNLILNLKKYEEFSYINLDEN